MWGCASQTRVPAEITGRPVRPGRAPPTESPRQRVWAAGLRVGRPPAGDAAGPGAEVPASAGDADPPPPTHTHTEGPGPLTFPLGPGCPVSAEGEPAGPPFQHSGPSLLCAPILRHLPSRPTCPLCVGVRGSPTCRAPVRAASPWRQALHEVQPVFHLSLAGPTRSCSPAQRLHAGATQWTPHRWTHHLVGPGPSQPPEPGAHLAWSPRPRSHCTPG